MQIDLTSLGVANTEGGVLSIDTLSFECSVALQYQGSVFSRSVEVPRHGSVVHAMIQEVIQEAKIKAADVVLILANRGPGSLTGLRVGLACCQGFGIAHGAVFCELSNCELLALQAYLAASRQKESARIMVCEDARLKSAYLGGYRIDAFSVERVLDDMFVPADRIDSYWEDSTTLCVGSGWRSFTSFIGRWRQNVVLDIPTSPSKAEVMLFALTLKRPVALPSKDACSLTPAYFRPAVMP